MPQAGGPGVFDPITLWRMFNSAVQAADPILGAAGAVTAIAAFMRRRLAPWPPHGLKSVYPGAVFSLVLARDEWAPRELANTCGIGKRDAAHLLQLCRYKKGSDASTYHRTSRTKDVIERLNAVQQYDE